MDESMSRGAPLDLAQADQITSLEVTISVLKLPQGRVGRSRVEDVAH